MNYFLIFVMTMEPLEQRETALGYQQQKDFSKKIDTCVKLYGNTLCRYEIDNTLVRVKKPKWTTVKDVFHTVTLVTTPNVQVC